MARLQKQYREELHGQIQKKLGLTNTIRSVGRPSKKKRKQKARKGN